MELENSSSLGYKEIEIDAERENCRYDVSDYFILYQYCPADQILP